MLVHFLLLEEFVLLEYLFEFGLELVDGFDVLGRVAGPLGALDELLDVPLLVLNDLPEGLDFGLELLYFAFLFPDYAFQVHHPLQSYLVGFLGLVVVDCLLQPLYHLVRVLQLQRVRLQRNWVSVAPAQALLLQLVLGCLLQLLVQPHRQLF